MDSSDLLAFLAAEVARLQDVAARNLAAPVPACPGWTAGDLVRHVAHAYQNAAVPQLRLPERVPAQDLTHLEPLAALQHGYAALVSEVAERRRREEAGQVVAGAASFWIRRMAHETAIHRIDAELAVAEPSAAIAPALAADGIDEFLTVILTYETSQWTQDYAADLGDWGSRWLLVAAGRAHWRITMRPDGAGAVSVPPPPAGAAPPAAAIHGDPDPVLRWVNNRAGADQVITTGDDAMIAQLRRLLTAITRLQLAPAPTPPTPSVTGG